MPSYKRLDLLGESVSILAALANLQSELWLKELDSAMLTVRNIADEILKTI
ncbi:hypothetical protein JRC04_05435 [Mycolicibacterium sp. S2-37]|uniref:hypothetical protein n=1 Tax=Mycolicibacterium sp. S2-37 TaxID=2810297 RepID=UPI001A94BE0E|nr:hypothetical protein [Mycolicibacterium sp. S2-37]MBO0676898.1 hypothetical protein [Mycolicibacterium sp. S2-37]